MMAEAELHARPDPVTTLKIGLGNAGSLTAAGFSIPFLRGRGRAEENSVTCQIQWRMRLSECHLRLEETERERASVNRGRMDALLEQPPIASVSSLPNISLFLYPLALSLFSLPPSPLLGQ